MNIQKVRPLPDLSKWIHENIFPEEFVYYTKTRDYISCFCSACGESYTVKRKLDPDFDIYGRYQGEDIVHNGTGKCQKCGHKVTFKASGRCKSAYGYYSSFLYGQRKGDQILLRHFDVNKRYSLNTKSEVKMDESYRYAVQPGTAIWKMSKSYPSGDISSSGNFTRTFGTVVDGYIHPSVWRSIKGSYLKYSLTEKIFGELDIVYYTGAYWACTERPENIRKFLRMCANLSYYPQLEYVYKAGFKDIFRKVICGDCRLFKKGTTLAETFGIFQDHVKYLKAHQNLLDLLRFEKKLGKLWNPRELEYLSECSYNRQEALNLAADISLTKQLNYLSGQEAAGAMMSTRLGQWSDYLRLKRQCGYEMDHAATFPRDLADAHRRIVEETNERAAKEREKKMSERFKEITKIFKKDNDKYSWEHGVFTIRLAKSAAEIVKEGRTLHHCVGASDTYMSRHAHGTSFILFLRREAQKPYVTVEYDPKRNTIRQWYGEHDTKPEKKKIDKWLGDYLKHMQGGTKRGRVAV